MIELEKALLTLYPEYDKIYGPYTRKDGRKHICLTGPGQKRKTISYPKAIVEAHIGRRLLPNETIDHDDRNFENNSIDNLKVKDRKQHGKDDAIRAKTEPVACPWCGTMFEPSRNSRSKRNRVLNIAGPFCSRTCSGKYGKSVQLGGDKLDRTELNITYYRNKKD